MLDGKSKRGSLTSPRAVLAIDQETSSITVPGRSGKTISAATEDVRVACNENDLATSIS